KITNVNVKAVVLTLNDGANVPKAFSLGQNYPNPFNPSTVIHFELPKESRVQLTLYNLLGQNVLNILDETRPAGVYDVQVDAGNLSSGVYFYRLTSGDFEQTKKMLLMK
ncbi:MAG TPA: T9SS type A sorting domain-containing protein, partial [Bacteroidota bacterium]|nr:T9SS type A sorting domain-containing protein [Bacteroidota bacterium]